MTSGTHVLSAKAIGLVYASPAGAGAPAADAVRGVWIDEMCLPRGRLTAVVGSSGSGKSTLLGMVSGLKLPNELGNAAALVFQASDRVRIDLAAGGPPRPGDMAHVFQEAHLMKRLSAQQNHAVGAAGAGHAYVEADFDNFARDAGLIAKGGGEAAELDALRRKPVAQLSGGQAQRIAIGRALGARPDLLLLDEPTSSLDEATGRQVMALVRRWVDQGGTALWITHNMRQAGEFADGFFVTAKGKLITADGGAPFALEAVDGSASDLTQLIEARTSRIADAVKKADDGVEVADAALQERQGESPSSQTCGLPASGATYRLLARMAWSDAIQWRRWDSFFAMLLAVLAAYYLLVGDLAVERYFDQQLSAPELSHFVVTTTGSEDKELMTDKALANLEKAVRAAQPNDPSRPEAVAACPKGTKPGVAPTGEIHPPCVYGRVRKDLESIILPANQTDEPNCTGSAASQHTASLIIARKEEPLYAPLFNALPAWEAKPNAIPFVASGQLIDRMQGSNSKEISRHACFVDLRNAFLDVRESTGAIAGQGTRYYEGLIELSRYLQASVREDRPQILNNDAAVYFDWRHLEETLCVFVDNNDPNATCNGVTNVKGYKWDKDQIDTVRGLVSKFKISIGLIHAGMVFFAVFVLITLFAIIRNFIMINEKFMCILRAFRYRGRHFVFLGVIQFFPAWFFGVLSAAALIFAVEWGAAAPGPSVVPFLAFQPALFFLAAAGVAFFTACISVILLLIWFRCTRFVGDTLQQS